MDKIHKVFKKNLFKTKKTVKSEQNNAFYLDMVC